MAEFIEDRLEENPMHVNSSLKNFVSSPSRSLLNLSYRLRTSWHHHQSQINENPIFIYGNQKSGTSAITGLLGRATGLSYSIDVLCLYKGLEEKLLMQEMLLQELLSEARQHFSKDIIKDPSFALMYEQFRERFPTAQSVFVIRDPRQNIRSILNRLKLPGDLKDLEPEQWSYLKKYYPNWYLVVDGELSGHKGRTYIESLALRCKKFLNLSQRYSSEYITIRYEDFNKEKINQIENLGKYLGLELIHEIEHIKDFQFQPKGNASIDIEDFFGYENLKVIEDICGDQIKEFGYSS